MAKSPFLGLEKLIRPEVIALAGVLSSSNLESEAQTGMLNIRRQGTNSASISLNVERDLESFHRLTYTTNLHSTNFVPVQPDKPIFNWDKVEWDVEFSPSNNPSFFRAESFTNLYNPVIALNQVTLNDNFLEVSANITPFYSSNIIDSAMLVLDKTLLMCPDYYNDGTNFNFCFPSSLIPGDTHTIEVLASESNGHIGKSVETNVDNGQRMWFDSGVGFLDLGRPSCIPILMQNGRLKIDVWSNVDVPLEDRVFDEDRGIYIPYSAWTINVRDGQGNIIYSEIPQNNPALKEYFTTLWEESSLAEYYFPRKVCDRFATFGRSLLIKDSQGNPVNRDADLDVEVGICVLDYPSGVKSGDERAKPKGINPYEGLETKYMKTVRTKAGIELVFRPGISTKVSVGVERAFPPDSPLQEAYEGIAGLWIDAFRRFGITNSPNPDEPFVLVSGPSSNFEQWLTGYIMGESTGHCVNKVIFMGYSDARSLGRNRDLSGLRIHDFLRNDIPYFAPNMTADGIMKATNHNPLTVTGLLGSYTALPTGNLLSSTVGLPQSLEFNEEWNPKKSGGFSFWYSRGMFPRLGFGTKEGLDLYRGYRLEEDQTVGIPALISGWGQQLPNGYPARTFDQALDWVKGRSKAEKRFGNNIRRIGHGGMYIND